jgi:hypothetical protein
MIRVFVQRMPLSQQKAWMGVPVSKQLLFSVSPPQPDYSRLHSQKLNGHLLMTPDQANLFALPVRRWPLRDWKNKRVIECSQPHALRSAGVESVALPVKLLAASRGIVEFVRCAGARAPGC